MPFKLKLGVTRAQHGREARRFFFAAAPFAGLLEMPVVPHFFQRALPVDFLFQPAQRLIYRFAFFQPDFRQLSHFLSGTKVEPPGFITGIVLESNFGYYYAARGLSTRENALAQRFGIVRNKSIKQHNRLAFQALFYPWLLHGFAQRACDVDNPASGRAK